MAELLPTGTVTLLLADVEGSTQLWETQSAVMTEAIAKLDATVDTLVAAHAGVRPVEQGEGDSFVVAFSRAGDAVACALALQRADLGPIRLRIGLHTGEVQLRDESNYAGRTINKTARLRDLAHGGQTVMSSVTEELVEDQLPECTWLTDLGSHALRDLPKPVRVAQLCHSELQNAFPPLRTSYSATTKNLPMQLTTFVGRGSQIQEISALLEQNRLVTLSGAGGAGKTRLAVEVAGKVASRFPDGVWYADLAPVTHPEVVPVAVSRALGLPDQPGRSISSTLHSYVRDRRILLVLDNCEHLLEACAAFVDDLLANCSTVAVLATSREPLLVTGEVNWTVPSLSIDDEAIELFTDRARRARPNFAVTDDNAVIVTEICRRLDGMPLAIELAAARVRALSLDDIADSLHDRFRLLTGGARTAVRRQQTLRASVDWSHALLTEPERVLFRRLAVFMGGFSLTAAQAVGGTTDVERFQVLDELSLLVDKSLVIPENDRGATRYRLLETVRQYALEKLGESDEAADVRERHCAHYTMMASRLDTPARDDYEHLIEQAELDIDNLRSAFTWSHENGYQARVLELASSLQPLWLTRGRLVEGLAWLEAALAALDEREYECPPAIRARALADKAVLSSWIDISASLDQALEALEIARTVDDPALTTRALTACACITAHDPELSTPYFDEATAMARALGDSWRLSLLLSRRAYGAFMAGEVVSVGPFATEGYQIAEAIGDRFNARQCRWVLINIQAIRGDLTGAIAQNADFVADATSAHDPVDSAIGLMSEATLRAWSGDGGRARTAGMAALEASQSMAGVFDQGALVMIGTACLADGDCAAAWEAAQDALRARMNPPAEMTNRVFLGQIGLACAEKAAALRWLDEAVPTLTGWWLSMALTTRARIHLFAGTVEVAEADAFEALAIAAKVEGRLLIPDILECIGGLACHAGRHRDAARHCGAADAARRRMGLVRFKAFDTAQEDLVNEIRNVLGADEFEVAWAEGTAMSTDEAVAYALRGRGERKRPSCGWDALTPTELQIAGLVRDGLSNKDIATRMFVSPRTVQSHLRHVYDKLDLRSRVQLAQEASRH
ncbi:LuxR C-terminal-related transcriptional regulator [Mycobacterium sp. E740]|uniref:helix-turn-helix transcriptional regulator n=1 Tax=Mycobacterium sp. E740 TaxID=1834149 RepID=UPI0009EE49A3